MKVTSSTIFRILAIALLSLLFIYGLVRISISGNAATNSEEPHGPWPFDLRPIMNIHMALCVLVLLSLISGIAATIRKERNYYFLAFLILLGISIAGIILGIVCFTVSSRDLSKELLKKLINSSVMSNMTGKTEGKKPHGENASREDIYRATRDMTWFNWTQRSEPACCGVNGYKDLMSIYRGKDEWMGALAGCCKRPGCEKNISISTNTKPANISEGCAKKMRQIQETAKFWGIELLVVWLCSLAITGFIYGGATEKFCLQLPRLKSR